jgi:hypothetical protein
LIGWSQSLQEGKDDLNGGPLTSEMGKFRFKRVLA